MGNTYKAILRGDRLEWSGTVPEHLAGDRAVAVQVTILDETLPSAEERGQGLRMAAALAQLAALDGPAALTDPAQWERELRQDRALPGQDG